MISCNHTDYYDPSCELCRVKGGEVLDMPDFLRNPANLIDELRAELKAKDERHHETVLALSREIDARLRLEAALKAADDKLAAAERTPNPRARIILIGEARAALEPK